MCCWVNNQHLGLALLGSNLASYLPLDALSHTRSFFSLRFFVDLSFADFLWIYQLLIAQRSMSHSNPQPLCSDWFWFSNTAVHIAVDRGWFSSYTPFPSEVYTDIHECEFYYLLPRGLSIHVRQVSWRTRNCQCSSASTEQRRLHLNTIADARL